jgi:hypothetical protein
MDKFSECLPYIARDLGYGKNIQDEKGKNYASNSFTILEDMYYL